MRVAIAGSGPAALMLGALMARRGHDVVSVDRDGGPVDATSWPRRGVMQFQHAHGVRPQVSMLLAREWPEAVDAWVAAGAEAFDFTLPDGTVVPGGHRSRRETLERALRAAALRTPGLELRRGHVDGLRYDGGRVTGLVVDGTELTADLVVDASGRAGRVSDGVRAPAGLAATCGLAYVDRRYRLRPGAEPGPLGNPIAWQADLADYQCLVFLNEGGHFSVLVVRPTSDSRLKGLRHEPAFAAAVRAIPGLAEWTDPARSAPVGSVLAGGELRNAYRGQTAVDGRDGVPGLLAVGDAVATTTPTFGRGLALTALQLGEVVRLLDAGVGPDDLGTAFEPWCRERLRPWVADHIHGDGDQVRRWEGGDVDLTRRLPSDRILAVAGRDPRIAPAAGAYVAMTALPAVLDPVEPLAHAVYDDGWRPTPAPGPSRDDLARIVADSLALAV